MKTGEEAVERAELKSLKAVSIAGLFLVAVIWGSTFTANKIVLETLSPLSLMAVRFLMAFAAMALIFRKRFAVLTTGAVKGGILCGISLFLAFVLQTYGLLYTDAGKQAFLSGAYVIAVPFLTWLAFRKKPGAKAYLGAALCFSGISLISLNSGFRIERGDFLTLISSFFFAAQIVIAGYYVRNEDPAVISTIQFGVMGGLSLLGTLITGESAFMSMAGNWLTAGGISLIYLGIIGTAVAYYLQILCQKHASPTTTSIILSLEAVFGSLLAVLILGETFTLRMISGAAAILVSILITES